MSERKTFTRGRRLAIGLNVLVASLLAPLVAGLLLYLAFRPELRRRFDFTSRRSFTLADRTIKVLEAIPDKVDVYTCFRPLPMTESGQPAPGMEYVIQTIGIHCNDLLREFEVRSRGKLEAHPYDAGTTEHLARITELGKLIGEPAINVAVVVRGTSRRVLRLRDLAAFDEGTQATQAMSRPTLNGFRDEEALVAGILAVTEERRINVGFLHGHGERDPMIRGVDASGRPGFSTWATGLAAQNYQLGGVDLAAGADLSRVDVLVVADPTRPIAPDEVAAIERYAKEGGSLALLIGPSAANSLDFPILTEILGLTRSPNPVCQVTTVMGAVGGIWRSEANVFSIDRGYSDHPIVKPLKSRQARTFWEDVGSLTPTGRADQGGLTADPLAWTGNDAWIDLPDADRKYNRQFDPGVEDRKGPYVLGYAVTRKDAGGKELGRAVVLGAASIFDDKVLMAAPANRDLGLNMVDWLAHREQLIALTPKPFDIVQVDLTEKEYGTIFLYVVFGVPAVALALGIAVFWLRRN